MSSLLTLTILLEQTCKVELISLKNTCLGINKPGRVLHVIYGPNAIINNCKHTRFPFLCGEAICLSQLLEASLLWTELCWM